MWCLNDDLLAPRTVPMTRLTPDLKADDGWLDIVWATVMGAQIVWWSRVGRVGR